MRETVLGANAHQDLPFEKLVEELQPVRDLSRNPLFQVLFVLQNTPGATDQIPGVLRSPFPIPKEYSKFDLTLFAMEQSEGIKLAAEYNTDLFDAGTIERMLGHYQVLLQAVAANAEVRVSQIALLSADEQQRLLVDFNATAHAVPRDQSLQSFIEQQAAATPEAPALIFETKQLSYAQLNAWANRLAHRLQALGVGPEVLVAVVAERSLEMVVALLGILKAGGAYVPVDPDAPRERLAVMLDDAEPRVVLTQAHLLDKLPPVTVPVICLDQDTLAGESERNPVAAVNGKSPAYMIYTSGSTGKPKGVPNVHEAIVNRLLWMQDAFRIGPGDRVLQKTPYSFDVSVWEFSGR